MPNLNIYMFDNGTGREIPEKIDIYPVNLLLGNTISEVHNHVNHCQLFCVFTPIAEADIVVPDEATAEFIRSILNLSQYNYNVVVKSSSIWYCKQADNNIIFSNTVTLSASELATILRLYINDIRRKQPQVLKMYRVIHIRTQKLLSKTPNWYDAKVVCDKNPCTMIVDNENNVLYKSLYGKVRTTTKLLKKSKNHIFQFNIK